MPRTSTTRKRVLGHGAYRRPKHGAAKSFSTSESRSPKVGRRKKQSDVEYMHLGVENFRGPYHILGRDFLFSWPMSAYGRRKFSWPIPPFGPRFLVFVAHVVVGPKPLWAAILSSVAHDVVGPRKFVSPTCFVLRFLYVVAIGPIRATK